MSFIFMVLHWPEPGHRDALAQSMREMRDALSGLPGCTAVEPPYLTGRVTLKWPHLLL
jgi:hypothetical protein